jgi:hypothetical protein
MRTSRQYLKAVVMAAAVALVVGVGATKAAAYGDGSPVAQSLVRLVRPRPTHSDTLCDLRLRGPVIGMPFRAAALRNRWLVGGPRVVPIRVFERHVIERRRASD